MKEGEYTPKIRNHQENGERREDTQRITHYMRAEELPEGIRKFVQCERYKMARTIESTETGWTRLDLHHPETLTLDAPFQVLSEGEAHLLASGTVDAIEKFYGFIGITGYLHVGHYLYERSSYIADINVSPWEELDLTKEDEDDYPISFSMCFNQTARRTPRFELGFPGAVHDQYHALVAEWDVARTARMGGQLQYDATHLVFEPGDLNGKGVDVYFPRDPAKLAATRITATGPLIHYPYGYGRWLERP